MGYQPSGSNIHSHRRRVNPRDITFDISSRWKFDPYRLDEDESEHGVEGSDEESALMHAT